MIGQKLKLFVEDLDASVQFYRDALAFVEDEHREVPVSDKVLSHTIMRNGPIILSLGLRDRLPAGHHLMRSEGDQGLGVEICLYVPDEELDAAYARACAVTRGRIDVLAMRPWGARDFRVADPDGYYVRVGAPDGEVLV